MSKTTVFSLGTDMKTVRQTKINIKWTDKTLLLTKTIYQLGFPCGQQSPQPAKAAVRLDRKATRNPQLYIVPSVMPHCKRPTD